jgi:hypothetical protein
MWSIDIHYCEEKNWIYAENFNLYEIDDVLSLVHM